MAGGTEALFASRHTEDRVALAAVLRPAYVAHAPPGLAAAAAEDPAAATTTQREEQRQAGGGASFTCHYLYDHEGMALRPLPPEELAA